jgi:cellulose synthase/poly-beta-1,6-N-acetylglucosamine synthase-like glycosyltransferase
MVVLFWICLIVTAYVYVGYPAVLYVWARGRGQRRRGAGPALPFLLPSVSVVIAVRNEAGRIASRLDNLLALDYPADRMEIIVVSDGSTDGTLTALEEYRGKVRVVAQPPAGKAQALNEGVQAARHSIVVFADARQRFARDALRALVAPFADPAVGAVSGELMLDGENRRSAPGRPEAAAAEGVGLYWRYEKWLRRRESEVGSTLGTTGAIYAMRRALWLPLPPETLLDDVLAPMRVVIGGHRVVFEERARAFDPVSDAVQVEARRKRRTLAGNYQILWLEPRLLVPIVNPVWFQYLSHKVGRLLVPYALVALFGSSLALTAAGSLYRLAFALQVGFYLLAAYGAVVDARAKATRDAHTAPGKPAARPARLPASPPRPSFPRRHPAVATADGGGRVKELR